MAQSKEKDYTIDKSMLINWLGALEEKIPVSDLVAWIEVRTNGEYRIIRQKNTNNKTTKTGERL